MSTQQKLLLLLTLSIFSKILIYLNCLYHAGYQRSHRYKNQHMIFNVSSTVKGILIYTGFFGNKPWSLFGEHISYEKSCGCNFRDCVYSYDTSVFEKSDLVLFHCRDMPPLKHLNQLNKRRKKGQRWLYFCLESPEGSPSVKPLDPFFNWSMSYRLNSDIWSPYARYVKRNSGDIFLQKNYAIGKTKQVAWLVSNCGEPRDEFVKKLISSGIQVDVGGACAWRYPTRLKCRNKGCKHLEQELKQYRFYLAAENGFCKDYVTEKYLHRSLIADAIPIVLGGGNYSNPALALPDFYINPLDFIDMKSFVERLKLLMVDDMEYNAYFEWKSKWKIVTHGTGCDKELCDMCQKLHQKAQTPDRPLSQQMNDDCKEPTKKFWQWLHQA